MDKVLIEKLVQKVPGMIQHYYLDEKGLPKGDWFVFQTSPIPSPLPPLKQLEMLTADVDKDRNFYLYDDGTLEHSDKCEEKNHSISKDLKTALKNISSQKFQMAVWENTEGVARNQPIVIALEPEINLGVYPDHPHINAGGVLSKSYLPESICYTDNPDLLGADTYTRVWEAIQQSSIWLFKQQLWIETRAKGKGKWIGLSVPTEEEVQFTFLRNPYGECWCGSNKIYHKCHLNQDFTYWVKTIPPFINKSKYSFIMENGNINPMKYFDWWVQNRKNPQTIVMSRLKEILR